MSKKISFWDESYRTEKIGGLKVNPDGPLMQHEPIFPRAPVLDLGMGDGRNALFFAKKDFEVEGIDISQIAIDMANDNAKKMDVRFEGIVGDLTFFPIEPDRYGLIYSTMVLHTFKISQSTAIINKMKQGIIKDGFVYLTIPSTTDPTIIKRRQGKSQIEKNTYYHPDKDLYVHSFTRDEVLKHFKNWKTYYCAETLYWDYEHKKDEGHYHHIIAYLGKKI